MTMALSMPVLAVAIIVFFFGNRDSELVRFLIWPVCTGGAAIVGTDTLLPAEWTRTVNMIITAGSIGVLLLDMFILHTQKKILRKLEHDGEDQP